MRHTPRLLLSIASSLALGGGDASAAEPARHPISADAPWALELDDALSKPMVEQWYGPAGRRAVAAAWPPLAEAGPRCSGCC